MGVIKAYLAKMQAIKKARSFGINFYKFREWSEKRKRASPFQKFHRSKSRGGLVKVGFMNKSMVRAWAREIPKVPATAPADGRGYRDQRGRLYLVFSDGSHRRATRKNIPAAGRKLVGV